MGSRSVRGLKSAETNGTDPGRAVAGWLVNDERVARSYRSRMAMNSFIRDSPLIAASTCLRSQDDRMERACETYGVRGPLLQ